MNENSQEELNSSFVENKAAHPTFLQRSVSAPAIAEHVSEAVLPPFNLDTDVEVNQGAGGQYANRLNPRIPTFNKKDMNPDEIDYSFFDGTQQAANLLLDESMNEASLPRDILNSLMNDSNRGALDLIQADFPGTPSAIFSNRLATTSLDQDKEAQADRNRAPEVTPVPEAPPADTSPRLSPMPTSSRLPAIMSSTATNDDALEEAAKSLQKLYVTDSPQHTMPPPQPPAQQFPHQYAQLHGNAQPNSFFHSPQQGSMLNNNAPAFNAPQKGGHHHPPHPEEHGNPFAMPNPAIAAGHAMPFMPGAGADLSNLNKFGGNPAMSTYNPNMMAMMMNSNQMQPAFNPMMGNAAFGNAFPGGQVNMNQLTAQPAAYYPPQQPLYVGNNGQPVYYRPGATNGQAYGQEFVYTPGAVEGGVNVGAGQIMNLEQQQALMNMNGFMQYQQQMANQVHPGFWPGQTDQTTGMPMFMPAQPVQGVRMGDDPSRMMYNQYGNGGAPQGAPYGMMAMSPMGPPRDMDQSNRYDDHRRDHHRDQRDGRGHRDRDGRNGGKCNPTAGTQARDSLVEEFRTTFGKSRQWTLRDLEGHVVAFCQDQHGSRFIQQRLEICSETEKQQVFDEIIPSAQILMTDVFGNYVLQKIFEYGAPEQCEALAVLLKGQAVQLSMQMYGCRVVQKALEYVSTERLIDLVTEFENPQMLIKCVHDSNGNHVIQKCIEVVSKAAKASDVPETTEYLSSRIQFIIVAFQGRVKELSSHPYGCRVVQRILEHCTEPQKAVVLEELRQCCGELVQDCYGNYVIQFVMQHGWEEDRQALIREVQTNLLDFSQHKFASNVVEKCLQFASKKDRDEMIWTIINVTFDLNNPVDAKGHCVLESMVRDPYANYVVQKVIDVSDERQRGAIMRYVKDNINQLRKYTYGKHIIVRLEKITNEKF